MALNFPDAPNTNDVWTDPNGERWIFTGEMWRRQIGALQGPQGIQGEQGEKGDKGDTGDPGPSDHQLLTNRDATDAHPIASVTGLQAALDTKLENITGELLGDLSDVSITTPSSEEVLKYNGAIWVNGPAASALIVSDTPPADPSDGDQWMDSKLGIVATWYVDADGGQWVSDPYDADDPTPVSYRKNRLINGNFDIWQRGSGLFPLGDKFSADRWWSTDGDPNTLQVEQGIFTLGQTDVPNNPKYFMRCHVHQENTAWCLIHQPIEGVESLSNGEATYSFWAKADKAATVRVQMVQNFGSGGSGNVWMMGNTFNITTSWQKFTFSGTVPSVAGKTIGDGNYLSMEFGFTGSDQTDFVFDFAQVQVEKGNTATDFEYRHIGEEEALCRRYFYMFSGAIYNWAVALVLHIRWSTAGFGVMNSTIPMRTRPTLTWSGNFTVQQGGNPVPVTNIEANNTTYDTLGVQITVASGLTAGSSAYVEVNNDIDAYIAWDAEL